MPSAPPPHPLLAGPIARTLLRLSLPNMLALGMSVLVAVLETWYIGQLGTVALAALALVFPFAMLTQMMSNGAMGSGVSARISHALGAGDAVRAAHLALHALVIGGVAGVAYSLLLVLCGGVFYGWLGARDAVLDAAVQFGSVLFSGAVLVWLCNTLASIVRGTGNMRLPSMVLLAAALVQMGAGGALGLGWGPVPRLGLTGVALGHVLAMACASATFLAWLHWGQARLRLPWHQPRLARGLFADILRVGAMACISPVQTAATALLLTGLVAQLGPQALAGYGIGQRLEFLLLALAFGIGMASVPMIGMAMGAGRVQRARQVAWTGSALGAGLLALAGGAGALWPAGWSGIFTQDALVLAHANLYLRTVGPVYGFFGLGLVLYFASLGAGHVRGPVLAGSLRLAVIFLGGAVLHAYPQWQGAQSLFLLVAAAMVCYGLASARAVWRAHWR